MAPFENDELSDFSLIHGPNEQGKTLLIDALVRMLFKKGLRKPYRRHFGTRGRNMNRVAENPEGFVVLESKGRERKLEANETMGDVLPVTVTAVDFLNVFVVRDSDLSLKDEDKYYSRVTEKLTGLRSSEIGALMRAIQIRGRLKSVSHDSDLANNIEQGKIADKVKDARALVDEIRALKESLLAEKFDELEKEMIGVRDRKAVLGRDAELQRAADETKRFKKARRALIELKRMCRNLANLAQLDPEQLKIWQKAVSRRESLESDLAEEKREAEKVERATRTAKKSVNAQEAKTEEAEKRLNRINAELMNRVDEYQYERAEFRRAEPQSGTYRKGLYTMAGIAALALIGYLIVPSNVVASIGVAALVVWLLLGWKQLKLRAAEGRLRAKTDRLQADIKRLGIEVESVDEVISTIGDLERAVLGQQQERQALRADLENLIKEKKRIENRIANKADQIAELDGEVSALQVSTQMGSVGDYQAALERRTKLEASAGAKRSILGDVLPTNQNGEAALDEWERRIDAHLQAASDGDQIEFDPDTLKRINADIEMLEDRKRQIQSALLHGSRKLHGIEIKAKELGVLDSSPPCRSTQELDRIGGLILEFCERIENSQHTAQAAIRICQQIDAEERARVSDLFGAGSPISGYMSAITDGRYTSVHYDAGKNYVYLTTDDGDRVPADFLSGGAYDQLYLAVRITIATRLLSDEKGFLILDDPFVKADAERLARMLGMLRHLVDDGWQILYFSAKDEVVDALAADIGEGRVKLVRLEAPPRRPTADDREERDTRAANNEAEADDAIADGGAGERDDVDAAGAGRQTDPKTDDEKDSGDTGSSDTGGIELFG
jgi:hypothetical protein